LSTIIKVIFDLIRAGKAFAAVFTGDDESDDADETVAADRHDTRQHTHDVCTITVV